MRSSLKFGLIASVMMVIPTFANAQLGGLGGLLDSLLSGSGDSSSSSGIEVGICVDGLGLPLLECPPEEGGSSSSGVALEVCVDGLGVPLLECPEDSSSGSGDGALPICVDGLGVPLLECPSGSGSGGLGLPELPCLDPLGIPLLNCPEGAGGNGGAGGAGGAGGNPGGAAGGAGGIAGNGVGRNLDNTALGTVGQQVVCFYVGRNFGGTPYCVGRGAVLPSLGGFNNAIRSIQFLVPGISVQVCEEENLAGTCTLVTATLPQLMGGWERRISSLRVL